MKDRIKHSLKQSSNLLGRVADEMPDAIAEAVEMVTACLQAGGVVYTFGNGGSAADAQHIACELQGKFMKQRDSMAVISLTTNTSALTAIGNDYGFEHVFARQLEGLGKSGDLALGISTSGNSPNVMEGVRKARRLEMSTIGLTGADGGRLKNEVDLCLRVPADVVFRIQEGHIAIGHVICMLVEDVMFGVKD